MSAKTIELFRRYTEKGQPGETHEAEDQQPLEERKNPNLVREMSRIEHEVRQMFDGASAADRANMIRFLEVLIRNLRRAGQ